MSANGSVAFVFRRNVFDRWIIEHPDGKRAWSGSRWVPVAKDGLPARRVAGL